MFVGDRGLGIGSLTKGFLRYGGHWKPKKNSLYSTELYTNEHSTSQTCPYCFCKLSHPSRVVRDNDQTQVKTVKGAFICVKKDFLSSLPTTLAIKTLSVHLRSVWQVWPNSSSA
ncbi:hypothetical protein BD408DRAFT_270765 [Parasitella parasitica]|nr:hypothetical protein BD408DRAFT_270765 [Parasitella parasitica]